MIDRGGRGRTPRSRLIAAGLAVATLAGLGEGDRALAYTPQDLWNAWPRERFVGTPAACLLPAQLRREVHALAARWPGRLSVETLGRSAQGREIQLLTLGAGPRKVMLWSQMHGDEPSATPALLDLAHHLLSHPDDPDARTVLSELTLLMVPMVNPDGAEVYSRRNAQAIDVNRDALNLATPEGRLLKVLRDRHRPMLGFNLHDQNRRRTVGETGVLAANAVLAVTGDREGTLTEGRLRARRAGVAVARALEPFAPGGLARYDDEWSPRAFGDNITAWGTPVLLIESGGVAEGRPLSDLTRLNFVAILIALRDLATNDLAEHDASQYLAIPENNIDVWADRVIRGGSILQPGSSEPYRADLAWNVLRPDRVLERCDGSPPGGRGAGGRSEIVEVGDARIFAAGREVAGEGKVVLAPLTLGVEGLAARRWLDGPGLDRLAGLGVVRVVWAVGARDFGAAWAWAQGLQQPGRARLEPTLDPLPPGLAVARRPPPAAAATANLGDRLRILAGGGVAGAPAGSAPARFSSLLASFWAAGPHDRPVLRPEAPASFMVVAPDRDIEATAPPLAGGRVESVWVDGLEVSASGSAGR